MDKGIPNNLLLVLEDWFQLGMTCIKWHSVVSEFFGLSCGIRQGGVLSRICLLYTSTALLIELNLIISVVTSRTCMCKCIFIR